MELICSDMRAEEVFPDYFMWETIIFNLTLKIYKIEIIFVPIFK